MVRDLAKHCSKGAKRKRFAALRDEKQKDLPHPIHLKVDVSTRWNSTAEALERALELKKTILVFTATSGPDKCPRFTTETFKALEQILPTLKIFLKMTERYSTLEVNVHKVVVDLHKAIKALTEIQSSATPDRRPSFTAAIDKLTKYLHIMLQNDWICAAFASDPANKEQGLDMLFGPDGCDMPERKGEVIAFIRRHIQCYETEIAEIREEEEITALRERSASPNPFACIPQKSPAASQGETSGAWTEFNLGVMLIKDLSIRSQMKTSCNTGRGKTRSIID